MSHRIRVTGAFRRDLRAQLAWLRLVQQDDWIDGLWEGLEEAMALLAEHPGVGALESAPDGSELRRLILRRVPYVVWYGVTDSTPAADVWLLRLFHARQRRPSPSWPAAGRGRRRPR